MQAISILYRIKFIAFPVMAILVAASSPNISNAGPSTHCEVTTTDGHDACAPGHSHRKKADAGSDNAKSKKPSEPTTAAPPKKLAPKKPARIVRKKSAPAECSKYSDIVYCKQENGSPDYAIGYHRMPEICIFGTVSACR